MKVSQETIKTGNKRHQEVLQKQEETNIKEVAREIEVTTHRKFEATRERCRIL